MDAMQIAAAEFAAGMTALAERITPPGGGSRMTIGAISADGRWGYEREGRTWIAFPRRSDPLPTFYAHSLDDARRDTFEHDHPMYGPERAPRTGPLRFAVV